MYSAIVSDFVLQISGLRDCRAGHCAGLPSRHRKSYWKGKMKQNLIAFITALALVLFLAGCALPQRSSILESDPIRGFEQIGPIEVYNKTNLFDFMNGEVVVYFPLGFRLLYTKTFIGEDTGARILVEIYDMGSTEGSQGVFEYYSEQESSIVDGIGESAWTDEWLLLFRRHIHFVRLSPDPVPDNPERPAQEEIPALARQIDALLR